MKEAQKQAVIIKNEQGIVDELRGMAVMVEPHPRFEGLYRFNFGKKVYMCSKWAISNTGK